MTEAGRCVLRHRGFRLLGDVSFQRSEADGLPVVIVPMGEQRAALPLYALQREMAIEDESDDGRMLALIAEALDYVIGLRPGDKLPSEVLTGEASWVTRPAHLAAARRRLRESVLRQIAPADRPDDLDAALAGLAPLIGAADVRGAASALDTLAHELSFIEASREVLLEPVRSLGQRLERLRADNQSALLREELMQSRRLAETALTRIRGRFEDVDDQTADIIGALRRPDAVATYIRSNRDWLYRGQIAWEPLLAAWARERGMNAGKLRHLVLNTYHFLAPRFMSVQEWQAARVRQSAPSLAGGFEW